MTNRGDRPIQVGSHYPLRRDQPRARLRSRGGRRACASTFPPAPPCASSPARRKTVRSSRSPATASRRQRSRRRGRRDRDASARGSRRMSHASIARTTPTSTARPPAIACGSATPGSSPRSSATSPSTATSASSAAARCCATAWARRPASATPTRSTASSPTRSIVDWTGIYKADIGIKDGRIAGIGKAGNPDVMAGVTPGMVVGVTTEAIAGEGLILTAGGIDTHIHFICPQQAYEALASGVTTFIGGGTGPGDRHQRHDLHARRAAHRADAAGDRRAAAELRLHRQGQHVAARRASSSRSAPAPIGLKLHEDWGTTPAAIDCCLTRRRATTTCRSRSTPTR